jgi:ABC-type multidrug transport system fused ATPase/permease subunit
MINKNLSLILLFITNLALVLAEEAKKEEEPQPKPKTKFDNISNKFTYAVYPILLILLFWGAKFFGNSKWNDGAFSLKQMKAIQGYISVCIMCHHISQKTCASWLSADKFVADGLNLFVNIGFYFVAIFLFCSGYGLYYSFHKKANYLSNGYFRRRVLPVVLSYYTTGWIFLVARFLMREDIDVKKFFIYFFGLKLSNPHAWFVVVLPFLYLFFYLSFRFVKRDGMAITTLFFMVFLYLLFGTSLDHNDWLVRGEWWYNSISAFPIGVLFAKYQKKVVDHFKKHNILYYIYMVVLFVGMFATYKLSAYTKTIFTYYGENDDKGYNMLRRWPCLITEIIACMTFVFFFFFLGMKIQFGNRFLNFMGTITLEFYLIHGLFLEPFAHTFADATPPIYHVQSVPLLMLIVFIPAIPSAVLLQKLHKFILGKINGTSKSSSGKTGDNNESKKMEEAKKEEAKKEVEAAEKEESDKMLVELVVDGDKTDKNETNN